MLSREHLPRNDGLDGGKGVAARLLGVEQGTADTRVQAHFVVDRLAGLLEAVGMIALGLVEQRPHEPVVQVDDFVDQRGAGVKHHGDQA